MTREQAVAEATRLGHEHPDRVTHSWIAREAAPGDWRIVRIGVPTRTATGSTQEAKPRPSQAADPRPPRWRDVGGPWAGGG